MANSRTDWSEEDIIWAGRILYVQHAEEVLKRQNTNGSVLKWPQEQLKESPLAKAGTIWATK